LTSEWCRTISRAAQAATGQAPETPRDANFACNASGNAADTGGMHHVRKGDEMNEYLERLFARIAGPSRTRSVVTPGDLYRRMSNEFRTRRPAGHGGCVMPMVVFRRDSGRRANWDVEMLITQCPVCERLASRISRRYAARFDLRDPASWAGNHRSMAPLSRSIVDEPILGPGTPSSP
jgi:hypothetical protein